MEQGPVAATVAPEQRGGYGGAAAALGVAAASGPDASATASPSATADVASVFEGLANFRSLTRERALATLRQAISQGRFERDEVLPRVSEALKGKTWEARQGGLLAAAEAIAAWGNDEFCEEMLREVPRLLLDEEYRVRKSVAGVLRECCKRNGLATYDMLQEQVLGNIRKTFARAPDSGEATSVEGNAAVPSAPVAPPTFLHDTEGWRTLETSMGALEAMMQGCGATFSPRVDAEMLGLLAECARHTNRFVREYAFFAYKDVFSVCDEEAFLSRVAPTTVAVIAKGVRDNWSQVRYAASVAARAFVEKSGEEKPRYYPDLLAPMCLNRHYMAEGVRLYSQQTWREMCGSQGGARLLMEHFDAVIQEYGDAARAPNHAVREAACHCISELGLRVAGTPAAPTPHREYFTSARVKKLLDILLNAFQDESWPVRDVASTAIGHFVASFPGECAPFQAQLVDLWFDQMQDSIPCLRKNGAAALAMATGAWPEVWEQVLPRLRKLLPRVEEQPENSRVFSDYTPSGPFSVPRPLAVSLDDRETVTDPSVTNKTMYSCGSLAPKTLRRKKLLAQGGCMNCSEDLDHQPWEASEGMIHLVVELASLLAGLASVGGDGGPTSALHAQRLDELAELMPLLARAFGCSHYHHSHLLKQRVCERLPSLAASLQSRLAQGGALVPLLRTTEACATQRSYLALYETGREALPGIVACMAESDKEEAAKGLDLGAKSLDAWVQDALEA